MKFKSPFRILLSAIAVALLGCATEVSRTSPKESVAFVIRVRGGGSPTQTQASIVQQSFTDAIISSGRSIASSSETADLLYLVTFVPDVSDPTKGSAYLEGIVKRPASDGDSLSSARQSVRDLEAWGQSRSAPP